MHVTSELLQHLTFRPIGPNTTSIRPSLSAQALGALEQRLEQALRKSEQLIDVSCLDIAALVHKMYRIDQQLGHALGRKEAP
ncbi:hypothetical protein [Corynebacterium pelargi]|uniref:Uncharacterized protein n=1 Tax=Corynebacterium pelargi TaxID=1471400 RepID=A0A410W6Q0_9CORY|nr:hypothetical protein [Corynebacterium pelargi]QAU51556.1 hypothetical protein CPELA_01280 [Corynebacterium pelargi]GGG82335.1 hypothetical protein GCM10007338_21540 [Corynebacterium pelargi]